RARGVLYLVSELRARCGGSVVEETSDWRQAYATVERFRRERPPNWARLPWAEILYRVMREHSRRATFEAGRRFGACAVSAGGFRDSPSGERASSRRQDWQ